MALIKKCCQPAYDMAAAWMQDHKDTFPSEHFDDLVTTLANDIQSTMEDFTNPDYIDITMKYLRRDLSRIP